ncbi:hypothetical protein DSLASN_49540 [Desulfoluna limicola]|uniref:O-antigen ligase-related domain-containing protein n=1 Tax=Desulfoluna limicola TaxID=2810562 RepID=A0ABM7PP34_9BACT|nr:O-antigen ligase family protein [Desulfoluna limicola]BCS99322.1 hypothetical protein DSLASN_49540 [Desulfoluna limicola]
MGSEITVDALDRRQLWGKQLDKAAFGLTFAFFLSAFVSKAAMNSLGALMLLVGLVSIVVNRDKVLSKHPFVMLFLIPLGVGTVAAIFSEIGGLPAVGEFLNRLKFFFLPLVLASVVKDEKRLWWLCGAVFFSGVVASFIGLSEPFQRNYGHFTGMHEIGRNADMLMIALLGLLVCLGAGSFRKKLERWQVGVVACVAGLFFWGMMMSGIRGAWVGFAVGLGCYSVFFNRKFLIIIGVLVVVACSIGPTGRVIDEVKSIGDTTSNASNLARLQLWKTGVDFSKGHLLFGSGSDRGKVRAQFKEFYKAQPEVYQKKYHWSIQYPGHFHNSYIQLFVEGGLLFFGAFIACGTLLMIRLVRALSVIPIEFKAYTQAAIVAASGFLATQFFHSELYSYGGALLMLFLSAGLLPLGWDEKKDGHDQVV